jgi:transcriptional regulator with XRE-family HTH domain
VPRLARLRQLRTSRLLTQAELAERSGVSRQTINRLEQGEIEARFKTIRDLADALLVRPSQLVGPTLEDAFVEWCEDLNWDRTQLAAWLGIRLEQLDALSDEPRPRPTRFIDTNGVPTIIMPAIGWERDLAIKHRVNIENLRRVLAGW